MLGNRVRTHRLRLSLTQEELAARSGVGLRTIRDIETGRIANPRPGTVRMLADALGLAGADRDLQSAEPTTFQAPCLLPPELPDFVGREIEMKVVLEQLADDDPAVRVVVISGLSGVGKTSLAVRLGHRLSAQSPGGQLYVDLRGGDRPLAPGEALGRLLRALGVDGTVIPEDVDERATLFRATVNGRRCLLVLDDAAGAAQVRPLLPGTAARVLVTSRNALVDLDGAGHVQLTPLPVDEAVELLTRIVGPERILATPEAAGRIASYCGGIPLAVRIVAANLVAQPHRPLPAVAADLADPAGRLDQLQRDDRSVRAVLDSAYRSLPEPAARLLRRLGLVDHQSTPAWVAGVLLADRRAGDRALGALSEANLVQVTGPDPAGQQRCVLHDLVHTFAREQAHAQETPDQRAGVLWSLLASWLTLTDEADQLLSGHADAPYTRIARSLARPPAPAGVHRADPHAWFAAEREALLGLIRQAAADPQLYEFAWTLAWGCEFFLRLDAHYDAVLHACGEGLAAAEQCGDWEAIAAMLLCVAFAELELGRDYAAALAKVRRARAAVERTGNQWLAAEVWTVTEQILCTAPDDYSRSAREEALWNALRHYQAVGDTRSAGVRLSALGALVAQREDPAAGVLLARAVELLRPLAYPRGLAMALRRLADWHRQTGDADAARRLFGECLTLVRELRDVVGQVCVHSELALLLADIGALDDAARHVDEALAGSDRLASSPGYERHANGRLKLIRGELVAARRELVAAVDALSAGTPAQVAALRDLAEAHQRAGGPDAAHATLRRALTIATRAEMTYHADRIRERLRQLRTDRAQ